GGSRYILRTHLARRADGTVDKYKKWLGLEGAKPDVIVFWTDRKVRIVSSLRGSSFTRTHTPPATFLVWDDMALHLLRDFVRAWRSGGDGPRDVLLVGSGAFAKAGISRAGVADVTMNDRAVPADVVAVEVAGQRLLVYADAEDELLGVTSGGLVAVRPGWTLGEVRAPEAVPPAEDPAPTAPATEEPPAGEAAAAPPEGEPAAEPPATEPPPDTSPRGEPGKPRPLPID
ncbi:MAG: hypothetical protein FJ098_08880, partial [Deltaproteobacteria bacterium]|nr:hypothetical protein [Deltaproteobacteria bacterium]